MNPALQALLTIFIGVGGCIGYFYLSNLFLDKVLFPIRSLSESYTRPRRMIGRVVIGALLVLLLSSVALWLFTKITGAAPSVLATPVTWLWWLALLPVSLTAILGGYLSGAVGVWGARAFLALATIAYLAAIALCLGYASYKRDGMSAGDNITRGNIVRPWLFLLPALALLGLYLAYPVFATAWLSLTDDAPGNTRKFVGLANYTQMFTEDKFWESMKNNMIWLLVVPAMSTAFGVLAAQLTDRIWWGNIAKSLIFMPMAISFVGASVIWKLIYDTRPTDQAQIGLLNAIWLKLGGGFWSTVVVKVLPALTIGALALAIVWMMWLLGRPLLQGVGGNLWAKTGRVIAVAIGAWLAYVLMGWIVGIFTTDLVYGKEQTWLTIPFWNNFFLMIVLVWIQTGFAMVIISGALRGVPEETIEAAILDGASPFQVFFQIKIPQIMGTIVVVWTTITITVLKVFDIVLAMTNGQWETQVLANYMFDKLFRANDWGVGSASAMIIMLLVLPILVWNVYNARKEMR